MTDKPKKGTKVKTIDRGMLPNVTVKDEPLFRGPKPILSDDFFDDRKKKSASDSTSRMKMGGKMKKYQTGGSVPTVGKGPKRPTRTPAINKIDSTMNAELRRDIEELRKRILKKDSLKMGGKVAKKVAPKMMMKKISKKK